VSLANGAYRTRKYLEPAEVEAIAAAGRDIRDGPGRAQRAEPERARENRHRPLRATPRVLRKRGCEAPDGSEFVFLSERGAFITHGLRKMLKRAGARPPSR
jgi:hypothetical protein